MHHHTRGAARERPERVSSNLNSKRIITFGDGVGAGEEVEGVLLAAIAEVVEEVASHALGAVVQQAAHRALPRAREAALQRPRARVLPAYVVPVVRPHPLELPLHLHPRTPVSAIPSLPFKPYQILLDATFTLSTADQKNVLVTGMMQSALLAEHHCVSGEPNALSSTTSCSFINFQGGGRAILPFTHHPLASSSQWGEEVGI